MAAGKRNIILQIPYFIDLRISTNFDMSNRKLGIDFLLPSAYKICRAAAAARGSATFQRLRWPETRKIQDFLGMAAGKGSILRQIP